MEATVRKRMETVCRLALIYRWSLPAKSNKSQHYGPLNSEPSSVPKNKEKRIGTDWKGREGVLHKMTHLISRSCCGWISHGISSLLNLFWLKEQSRFTGITECMHAPGLGNSNIFAQLLPRCREEVKISAACEYTGDWHNLSYVWGSCDFSCFIWVIHWSNLLRVQLLPLMDNLTM